MFLNYYDKFELPLPIIMNKKYLSKGCEMGHDELFAKVVPYTMEEMGVLEFFQALTSDLKYTNPKMGKWFVSGSRHYSWDKVLNEFTK